MTLGTVECDRCLGAGERVTLTKDGREKVVTGANALDLLKNHGWSYAGVSECGKCHGFGKLNAAEHNV